MALKKESKYFIVTITLLLAMLTAMSPLAIDTYLSSMPIMAHFFGVNISKVEITLTMYFLGFALGNFFGGPLSDAFGRKTLAITGIILYGFAALAIPFCTNIEQVWVLRVVQAFGGGFASVTAMVFVRDWFEGKQVARLATIISMIMMFAPLVAPVIGTALGQLIGWHSIFYFLAVFALLLLILFLALMPESRHESHITRRITVKQFIEKYQIFFKSKKAIILLLTIAFSMSGMFVFITSSSFIYLEYFGLEAKIFPLLFMSNVLLNVGFSFLNNIMLKRHEPEKMLRIGLLMETIAGLILFISTVNGHAQFVPVFIGIVLYVGSLGMVFGNGTAMILNLLPEISGSANAMIGVTRFIFSFVVGSMPALFYTGNLLPIGTTMFVCALLGFIFYMIYSKITVETSH